MNRRELMTGVVAAAVVPALPAVPIENPYLPPVYADKLTELMRIMATKSAGALHVLGRRRDWFRITEDDDVYASRS